MTSRDSAAPFSAPVAPGRPPDDQEREERSAKVLFVASECVPYAKTGGLADVVAALAKTLQQKGCEVRVILPLYGTITPEEHGIEFARSACVHMGGGVEQWVGIHSTKLAGRVPVWFVDYKVYFDRPGLYGDSHGEYGDNGFRFALFCKAAIQLCKDTGFIPDVIHAHDWQGALAPAFLKTWDRYGSPVSGTASVLTIHNIGYQGICLPGVFPYIGVGYEHFTPERFEWYGNVNLLKAGIYFADALTTVSPTHADEILGAEGGMGLAGALRVRRNDLTGILNGVDYEHWDPATDALIPANYGPDNLDGKRTCRRALQETYGLPVRDDLPVFGMVARLVQQKGVNLLREALPRAFDELEFQLVLLGTGEPDNEEFFRWLAAAYPDRAGCRIGYSEALSHLVEAGSDFFLMPSLYEPCGLNQIYSMKYGTLPIVHAVGGLADTVENYTPESGDGTGFTFQVPAAEAFYRVLCLAMATWYEQPDHIARLRQTAMSRNFSWDQAAEKYVEVYRRAVDNRRIPAI